jgi:hypothetical protein
MNKIFTLLFLVSFTFLNAQENTPFSDLLGFSSPYDKAILTLRNGDTLTGLARINGQDEIVFKKKTKDEKVIYDYKTVSKIELEIDRNKTVYVYKIIEGRRIRGIMLLKPFESLGESELQLFTDYYTGSYNMNGFQGTTSKTTYFICKNNSSVVTYLGIGNVYSKAFKKEAKRYFKSCPDLLEKINNKYFKRYGIVSVVEYYNLNCNQ